MRVLRARDPQALDLLREGGRGQRGVGGAVGGVREAAGSRFRGSRELLRSLVLA